MDTTFRAVAETVTDAVISADSHGHITYINRGGERLFGWASAELRGRQLAMLMPERFRASNRRGLLRYATTSHAGPTGPTIEFTGLRKDGREFPMELSLARWDEESGVFFTAIVRDISERKQRDEELRAINAQLEMANKELETFSYSVSHDLRAPIRSIDGFSAILQQDYGDKLDERGRDCLNRVRAAAQRMHTLIDAMLILSRVTREEMRRDVVDLSSIARSVANDLQRTQPERPVDFIVASGVVAVGDGSLIRVVLENLLNNAWKFTSKQPDARIEFGITTEHDGEAYFVRDNGAGFNMTHVDKLFGAFQRLHTAEEFPGTGIGLPTVQRIVHRHGGRAWAEGQVGGGATFYFTLAADSQPSAVPRPFAAREFNR
jgi:PAS domain S-box-containing protein